jgi:enterobactin synthetase component D
MSFLSSRTAGATVCSGIHEASAPDFPGVCNDNIAGVPGANVQLTARTGTIRPFSLGVIAPFPVFLTPFVTQSFDSARFASEGIFYPPEIARSVVKRQAEYFHGRLCARHALQAMGITGHIIINGRMREPLWPAGVIGSITHSVNYAAAVAVEIGGDKGIGIDIENVVDATAREAVLATAINRHEYGLLSGVAGLPADHCLTLAFSIKESFFKASFGTVGRYFDFDAVTLTEIDPVRKTLSLHVNHTLCPLIQRGQQIQGCFDLLDANTVITGLRI